MTKFVVSTLRFKIISCLVNLTKGPCAPIAENLTIYILYIYINILLFCDFRFLRQQFRLFQLKLRG